MAPEVFDSDDEGSLAYIRGYSSPADVWSLGVIILEMAINQKGYCIRFDAMKRPVYLRSVRLPSKIRIPDPALRSLLGWVGVAGDFRKKVLISVLQMLQSKPRIRPTVEQIKGQPYFWEVNWAELEQGIVSGGTPLFWPSATH